MPLNEFADVVLVNDNTFIVSDVKGEFCLYEIDAGDILMKRNTCDSFTRLLKNASVNSKNILTYNYNIKHW
jgi:hypothetical protein